jgi:hypothetical protein
MFRIEGECDWKATSKSSFIHLITDAGTFSSPLTFLVDPNTGGSRRGIILVEWEGGSLELPVDQSSQGGSSNFQLSIELVGGSECAITTAAQQCTFKAVSNLPNGIVSYSWRVDYSYGTLKVVTGGGSDTFVVTESCGGPGTSASGLLVEAVVTLNVTDSAGGQFTVITGQGGHPEKFFRIFTCS